MLDKRAKKLANIIVDYSLYINSKDILLIQCEEPFKEFAEYIGECAEKKKAKVIYDFYKLSERKKLIERNNIKELKQESKEKCELAEKITARVAIDAESDPFFLKDTDPKKISDYSKIVRKPVLDRMVGDGKKFKGIKWNIVAYPCTSEAKIAKMSFKDYTDFLFKSTNIDWKKEEKNQKKIKKIFDDAKEVRIFVPNETDLSFSLKGRGGGLCYGNYNMPDGEVFYGPNENSANGKIYFQNPVVRDGNIISGIRLEFKNGKVISFSAEKNNEFLKKMLELKGAKRLGEFGIGCNYNIKQYISRILFDEKIGGTIHLALGNSYRDPISEGGGKNDSEIHWDLICDLRNGGEIYVNGKLVQKNGKWLY